MENELITFVEKFFKNIGAKTLFLDNYLEITNVPESFEKFYGKKSPYKFVFKKIDQTIETELVEKGSYVLKSIYSYLENAGQTTLLKIDFKINPIEKITKKFTLENAKLVKLTPKKRYNFFFRFTFHTSFQFINKREKIINDIYVYDGKIIEGDLSNYPILEGSKNEVKIPDMKEPYFIAKDELRKKIEKKTSQLALELSKKMEKEKERIETHFLQELKEHKENLEKATNKLIELGRQENLEKISKQKKLIETLREKVNIKEIEEDKQRAIQLERQKHILNVNNKLFNTTLIYYPLFTYDAILKNSQTKRVVEISYDPLNDSIKPLLCESCNTQTHKLFLCSTGHISCENCNTICESCQKEFCIKCVKTKCEICSKQICKDCATRCYRCSKVVCKNHTKKDKISGKIYCENCLKRCERCSNLKDPTTFKLSKKTNAPICEECFRNEMQGKVLEGVFEN